MNLLESVKRAINELIIKIKGTLNRKGHSEISKLEVYNALTPNNKADLKEYENALLHGLNHKDVKNIAITGPYGSGKSSILRTFENKYNGFHSYEFLNISLATFDTGSPALDDEKRMKLNSDVEKSLLQQIFFKVGADELEDSHFSRLKVKKYKHIPILNKLFLTSNIGQAFLLITLLSSLGFILNPDYKLFKNNILFNPQYNYLYEIFIAFSAIALLQQIFNSFPKIGLNKLGAAGAEISFNEKKGDSILNKFIDELIYFFEKTKYNIVVFEDLDRFQSRDIFIKLREINTLLNYSDEILNKNKIIKFIFVLGDDVFQKSEDRTKFFDFIVPIIPVINSFNAEEKLRSAINNAFENHSVEKNFFEDISLFIDDMRMLLNIANEFVIYKKMLTAPANLDSEPSSEIQLDDTKLLSLIIYKNKYPEDFKQLNYRKGIVANIFAKINKYRHDYAISLKQDIDRLNERLSEIDNEETNSLEELRLTYVAAYFQLIPDMRSINIENTYRGLGELLSEDLFNKLISKTQIDYIRTENRYTSSKNILFSEIEASINPNFSYTQRKQNITDKTTSTITGLKRKIKVLESEIKRAPSLKFDELLKKLKDPNIFEDIDTKILTDCGLIRFLIVNGYIEEDYDSYMSFFYPGELSANDKQFLISLANHKQLDFKYPLSNPGKVYERIQPERFSIRAILNYDLLDYLLKNMANSHALHDLLSEVYLIETEGYKFIDEYLSIYKADKNSETNEESRTLINKLSSHNKNFWMDFFRTSNKDDLANNQLFGVFLREIHLDELLNINIDNYFSGCISKSKKIFEILPLLDFDRVKGIIKLLKIKFLDISSCDSENILQEIKKQNAYDLSDANILKILNSESSSAIPDINAGYTCILQSGHPELVNYVDSNLEIYIKNVLLLSENITESEFAISKIINSQIDAELISELIEKFYFKIENINSITNKYFWSHLLKNNRLSARWSNLLNYFEYEQEILDEHLITFLNNTDNSLQLSSTRLNSKDDNVKSLSIKIVYCDEIIDSSYKHLIESIPYRFLNLSDLDISAIKIKYLIDADKFQLTKENHDYLKENLSEFSYQLIERNYSTYAAEPTLINLESQEYISLINSTTIKNSEKISIIQSIPDNFYDENNVLAEVAVSFVIQNTIEKIFPSHIAEKLLGLPIKLELKVKIFNRHANDFDRAKIKNIVSKIDTIGSLTQNKRPKIISNTDTLALVMFLSVHHFLSYKEEKGQLKLTPKRRLLN
ncbi:YobI family P-loop NTPase [Methylovorus mays]|uniref:YobI family P-loop NTPase n=1 Tax=Methylovorus mays TaxID=184077 RepID=UPI001E3755E2|nr:hypothetical protein [Methylovorus mays]MCB5207033.1 hypothetical protein [Methylovorus mays]